MIELRDDSLVFSFQKVHPKAQLTIGFQRTLRIPDDETCYLLPPGLGRFPLRHVDDFAERVPADWSKHGGVMLPMHQAEALWIRFDSDFLTIHEAEYPFAVKIATGKINAVTGKAWNGDLHERPQQDYVTVPGQPWLDGYCVEKGIIRQFVAMPLGKGYSAEEQITGKAEHGGMQIAVFPMKREAFERHFPKSKARTRYQIAREGVCHCVSEAAMGLAPRGRMKQGIYRNIYPLEDWATEQGLRCFVHIANSETWMAITGEKLPTVPPTAKDYTEAGLPWFDYYGGDLEAMEGSKTLGAMKSAAQLGQEKGEVSLPGNESVEPVRIIRLTNQPRRVREGAI